MPCRVNMSQVRAVNICAMLLLFNRFKIPLYPSMSEFRLWGIQKSGEILPESKRNDVLPWNIRPTEYHFPRNGDLPNSYKVLISLCANADNRSV
jgi:hypothetical protein